jgi:MYXO-CTERM domain-containing protein
MLRSTTFASVLLFSAGTALGQYMPGFQWHRDTDWTPGAAPGTSQNNPSPDANNVPVWSYEWAAGGPLGSANPWYAQSGAASVWDGNWFGNGQGAWARDVGTNPPVFRNRLTHNIVRGNFDRVPMVRWMHPLGDGAMVEIHGELTVRWTGDSFIGSPVDVDVVIARYSAGSGGWDELLGQTVAKPIPSPSVGDFLTIPVGLSDVAMNAGDQLVFSLRGREDTGQTGRWLVLNDDVTIELTAVPSPGAAGVLVLAGLLAGRRRR